MLRRVAARALTGPLAFLVAGLIDLCAALVELAHDSIYWD